MRQTPPFHVLFICTANACRSQMAEAVLRQLGGNRFVVRSAGVDPFGQIHPLAVQALRLADIPMTGHYSKSYEALLDIEHDIVLTVCDSVACLTPPQWQGEPVTAHWSLPDPVLYPGEPEEQLAIARQVVEKLQQWVRQFIALPLDTMPAAELRQTLYRIAQT